MPFLKKTVDTTTLLPMRRFFKYSVCDDHCIAVSWQNSITYCDVILTGYSLEVYKDSKWSHAFPDRCDRVDYSQVKCWIRFTSPSPNLWLRKLTGNPGQQLNLVQFVCFMSVHFYRWKGIYCWSDALHLQKTNRCISALTHSTIL